MLFSLANLPWWTILAFLGAFVIAVTFHEYAHAAAANALGDPTARYQGRQSLNPLAHLDPVGTLLLLFAGFGWGRPVPYNPHNLRHPRRDALLISLAGPAANLLLALLSVMMLKHFWPTAESGFGPTFLMVMVQINVLLMIFNLLPIPPLDGAQIITSLTPAHHAHLWQQWIQNGPMILFTILILEHFLPNFHPFSNLLSWLSEHVLILLWTIS
jgi:Zn-dependent protease